MEELIPYLEQLGALVPVVPFAAPLIALLIDQLKRLGFPDGWAPALSAALNIAVVAAIYFTSEQDVKNFIAIMQAVAPYAFVFFVTLYATAKAHNWFAGIGLGYSHPKG